jgi:hypothetical protein
MYETGDENRVFSERKIKSGLELVVVKGDIIDWTNHHLLFVG